MDSKLLYLFCQSPEQNAKMARKRDETEESTDKEDYDSDLTDIEDSDSQKRIEDTDDIDTEDSDSQGGTEYVVYVLEDKLKRVSSLADVASTSTSTSVTSLCNTTWDDKSMKLLLEHYREMEDSKKPLRNQKHSDKSGEGNPEEDTIDEKLDEVFSNQPDVNPVHVLQSKEKPGASEEKRKDKVEGEKRKKT
ncbi:unnamed protein product [Mytilus coruscus]|uniref:Uncharacterized protein n=1 Tax=Mytilus coruscus TaxID=42192 RepID=A0A6J8CZR8_MYTCO|nr:unnamed protein product [Mytilus coruscus]